MANTSQRSIRRDLALLHPAFALTGVFHAIVGALLPSISTAFHLTDSQSGSLVFLYFAGTSIGALLCLGSYARLIPIGFGVVILACAGIVANFGLLHPLFLMLGIGVGIPMSAVSMFTGALCGERSAAPLTFLNFSWSLGALLAPLLAAELLVHFSYRSAYCLLAGVAVIVALICALLLRDPENASSSAVPTASDNGNLRWIVLFSFLAFLEVGIENTTATWLATFVLRTGHRGIALAVASSSLYWCGFLISRGVSSFLLLRVRPMKILAVAVAVGVVASSLMLAFSAAPVQDVAMFFVGTALAPVFPLLLSRFFAVVPQTSASRWVLATCGFGGSVVPWVVGSLASRFQSLRVGLMVVPAGMLLILVLLPLIRVGRLHGTKTYA